MEVTRTKPGYSDARGDIFNLVTEPIEHVARITCEKGAVRGNHLHHQDSHYTFMESGVCSYYEERDGLLEETVLEAGDMVFTPAGRPHAFVFTRESVFYAFTTRKRMEGAYDEDTERRVIVEV